MSDMLSAALRYLEAGFSLFPLQYRSKHPKFNLLPKNESAKGIWTPFIETKPNEKQVRDWFEWFTGCKLNIALVMGQVSGNVIALDFDDHGAYDAWMERYPSVAATATQITTKGAHVLLRVPPPIPRNWKIMLDGQHVGECRGEGGYIAVWPSIHPSGKQYEWVTPPWKKIITVDSLADVGISRVVETGKSFSLAETVPKNGKHPLPPRTQNFMINGAVVGSGRNEELYQAAVQHRAAGYSEHETIDNLLPVAERFYIDDGPGNTKNAAIATIRSGWKGGAGKEPITLRPPGPATAAQLNGPKDTDLGPPERPGDDPDEESPNGDQFRPKYILKGGQMIYITYRKDNDSFVAVPHPIPFWGRVTDKLTLFEENGEQKVIYTIKGQKDKRAYTVEVDAVDFADGRKLYTKLLDYLPGGPPILPQKLIHHVSTAISAISKRKEIVEVNAIPSTGWTPDGTAFVMPNGTVGESGYICKLSQELSQEFQFFGFRQNTPEENKTALDALKSLCDVYRPEVIYVTLAHAFLPPLLRWMGNEARYLLHIHADTGSFKTELVKLIMSLYGPVGDVAITYKWSGTAYGAEARAHVLKDCLMLIDDLKPSTITPDMLPKWIQFVQSSVDAMGRKRATITGRAASALPPRALLISTGEAIPEAGESSYNARMLLAELASQPTGRNTKLDQIKATSHLFSGLMGAYIGWLLRGNGERAIHVFKQYQADSIKSEHTRLANNYAANCTGGVMLAEFCHDTGLMNDLDKDVFIAALHRCIYEVVGATGRKVREERYSQKFISALRDAISTGYAYVSEAKPDARRVGWQDNEFVYLTNGALSIVNQWLRNSGEPPINIPTKEIRKQLFNDGLSFSTDARVEAGHYDVQRTDPADQSKPMVTAIYRDKFYNTEISNQEKAT